MKALNLILTILTIVGLSVGAHAGDKIGNGGGLWVCQGNANQVIQWANLVDLYEARDEFKLHIPPAPSGFTVLQILDLKLGWLATNYPQLLDLLQPYIGDVENNIVYVNGVLQIVDDTLYRVKPAPTTCPNGTISYVQFANFTNYGKVLVQSALWNNKTISEVDKAALIFHEIVYRMLRSDGDTNSVRARRIVGLFFSDLNAREMRKQVKIVLNSVGHSDPAPVNYDPSSYFRPGLQMELHHNDDNWPINTEVLVMSGNNRDGWKLQLSGDGTDDFYGPVILELNHKIAPETWTGDAQIYLGLDGANQCGPYQAHFQVDFGKDSELDDYAAFTVYSFPFLLPTSGPCADVNRTEMDTVGIIIN